MPCSSSALLLEASSALEARPRRLIELRDLRSLALNKNRQILDLQQALRDLHVCAVLDEDLNDLLPRVDDGVLLLDES